MDSDKHFNDDSVSCYNCTQKDRYRNNTHVNGYCPQDNILFKENHTIYAHGSDRHNNIQFNFDQSNPLSHVINRKISSETISDLSLPANDNLMGLNVKLTSPMEKTSGICDYDTESDLGASQKHSNTTYIKHLYSNSSNSPYPDNKSINNFEMNLMKPIKMKLENPMKHSQYNSIKPSYNFQPNNQSFDKLNNKTSYLTKTSSNNGKKPQQNKQQNKKQSVFRIILRNILRLSLCNNIRGELSDNTDSNATTIQFSNTTGDSALRDINFNCIEDLVNVNDLPVEELTGELENQNEYVIHSVVNRGTYGTILSSTSSKNGRTFAIKRIIHREPPEFDGFSLKEISILKKISFHDQIAEIYKIFMTPKSICIVMEYAPMDLDEYSKYFRAEFGMNYIIRQKYSSMNKTLKNCSWNLRSIRYIMKQILVAVGFLHSLSIIHRDLKLKNVLIFPKDQNIKLVDFGLVCIDFPLDQSPGYSNSVITLWYRPIELFLNPQKYGTEIDVWSCGIMYYELLQFNPPVCQNENKQLKELIRKFRPNINDFEGLTLSDDIISLIVRMNKKGDSPRGMKLVDYLLNSTRKVNKLSRGIIEPRTEDKEIIGLMLDTCIAKRVSISNCLRKMDIFA